MGDVILTTPLVRALRQAHPEAWISYVTKRLYAPLLAHNPRVNEVIELPADGRLGDLARTLRERHFTHGLDLHGSLRSRALRWMVGGRWRGYPKRRLARSILIRTKRDVFRDRRHVVERYFDAARGLGVAPDGAPADLFLPRPKLDGARRFLVSQALGTSRSLVALAPGAAHWTKRWPVRHWQRLATQLTLSGYDVVVLGGPAEQNVGEEIAAAGDQQAASAAGRFDLLGTAALLKEARCVVVGDTGVMHMATAVGVPVVTLFGPTVRAFGYPPYQARATILEEDLPCRPCSAMGGPRCPLGHHHCLENLAPDRVFQAVRHLPR
jgi:lipopolysaccharide heptosyltransferase II